MSAAHETYAALDGSKVLLTVDEAARALSVGRTTLYGLLADGRLPSVRIGRARRVSAAALRDFAESLTRPDTP